MTREGAHSGLIEQLAHVLWNHTWRTAKEHHIISMTVEQVILPSSVGGLKTPTVGVDALYPHFDHPLMLAQGALSPRAHEAKQEKPYHQRAAATCNDLPRAVRVSL